MNCVCVDVYVPYNFECDVTCEVVCCCIINGRACSTPPPLFQTHSANHIDVRKNSGECQTFLPVVLLYLLSLDLNVFVGQHNKVRQDFSRCTVCLLLCVFVECVCVFVYQYSPVH